MIKRSVSLVANIWFSRSPPNFFNGQLFIQYTNSATNFKTEFTFQFQ